MESIVRKIRKAVIIIGCAAILVSVISFVFLIISAYVMMTSPMLIEYRQDFIFPIMNPITNDLYNFLSRMCITLAMILIALWVDPAKVSPVFNKKNGCNEDDYDKDDCNEDNYNEDDLQ